MFFCPFAQATWRLSAFSYTPRREGFVGFRTWWDDVTTSFIDSGSHSSTSLISYLCWNLWKARNALLFEGQSGDPERVWNTSLQDFLEFSGATVMSTTTRPSPAVCRDQNGVLIDGASGLVHADSVDVAEAFAVRLACTLTIRHRWHKVILESDNKGLIRRLNNPNCKGRWDSRAVEDDIRRIINQVPSVSFVYVHRSANLAADWVAKKTRQRLRPHDWMFHPPTNLVGLL
ncbi:hypothetical protein COLO4_04041 [Corchorus olitorius]|uniref:RNase H type-1 domain-containing protein n=1 Tax=Corchorus olitorius TaxID=93759 RepID=A0A1R3KVJ9_9ROSI|nr:hypothetical protein COLO4_04041 [Corchorus olitorius]